METLKWKTRIALLWVIAAVGMSGHKNLVAVDPAAMKIADEWAATAGPAEWAFTALFWFAPMWMAFITMTVKGSSNHYANLIVGVVSTILNIWHFFMCGVPLQGGEAKPSAHHILLVGSTVVATALIAWFSWKWPKQEV